MHFNTGEFIQDRRHVGEFRPVELDVLPCGEVAVAAVIGACHMGQHPHLSRVQRAIGNGHPEHIGMKLQIDPVHQPQRLEGILADLASKPPRDLVAKLIDAVGDKGVIEFVVTIHRCPQAAMKSGSAKPWPSA